MSDFPDNQTLLSLSEVCATLLGFVGVVVVLGRRSTGEWNDMERGRMFVLRQAHSSGQRVNTRIKDRLP